MHHGFAAKQVIADYRHRQNGKRDDEAVNQADSRQPDGGAIQAAEAKRFKVDRQNFARCQWIRVLGCEWLRPNR